MYQTTPPAREVVFLNERNFASCRCEARSRRNTTSTSTNNNYTSARVEFLLSHFEETDDLGPGTIAW
jgi:hypothetical protein